MRVLFLLGFYITSMALAGAELRGQSASEILDSRNAARFKAKQKSSAFKFKSTCKDTGGKTHTFGDYGFDQCMINKQTSKSHAQAPGETTYGVSVGTE